MYPENFQIIDVNRSDESGFYHARVQLTLPDKINEIDVAHIVRTTVRLEGHDEIAVAELEEALTRKAEAVLRLALSKLENSSAKDLIHEATERHKRAYDIDWQHTDLDES